MKKLLASMIVLAGASLAAPSFAADPMAPGDTGNMGAAQMNQQQGQGTLSKTDLVGRKVLDSKGTNVGQVKDVVTDSQGQAINIIVTTKKKDVALSADEIKVASNDTLQSTKTAKEINKLPAAPANQSGAGGAPSGATGPMNGPSPSAPSGAAPASPGAPY